MKASLGTEMHLDYEISGRLEYLATCSFSNNLLNQFSYFGIMQSSAHLLKR